MAGEVRIGGTTHNVRLQGNDSYSTADRTFTFPDTDGELLVEDTNGDVEIDGNLQVGSLNGGQLAGFRNQIINGDFRVWQRGTDGYFNASNTISYESADRWGILGLASGNQLARSENVPAGFDYSATIDQENNASIRQRIELYDQKPGPFVSGSQWTLSVWASNQIRARVQDSAGNTLLAMSDMTATSETSNTFTRYTATFSIVADASGDYLEVALQNQNGVLMRVTGCQLEPGPVATPFEHRPLGIEEMLCIRYFWKFRSSGVLANTNRSGAGNVQWMINNKVAMRISNPTIEGTTGFRTQGTVGGGGVTTLTWAGAANMRQIGGGYLRFVATSTGGANTRLTVHEGANDIQLNAEL